MVRKSVSRMGVRVRVPPSAPFIMLLSRCRQDLLVEPFEAFRRYLALPNHQHGPSRLVQFLPRLGVPLHGRVELIAPEFNTTGRHSRPTTARVSVPEATVDEHDNAPRSEYQIGAARQVAPVKAEPKAMAMKVVAHGQFGLRVFRPNPGHDLASFFCRKGVHVLRLPPHEGAQQLLLGFQISLPSIR